MNTRCTGAVRWLKREKEKTMLVALKHVLDQAGTRLVNEEDGQGLVEYVLIIALIAILLVGGLGLVQGAIGGQFTAIDAALP
jgi:pilus assembly protein Flp/PilA